MTLDDPPPRPPKTRPAPALWWALVAAAAVVLGLLLWRPEGPKHSPAEHNTVPVQRAPVQLPASR